MNIEDRAKHATGGGGGGSPLGDSSFAVAHSALAVVPARMASTRFPGKPLASQTGKPMIQHVVERVRLARSVGRIIVATDDERIRQAVGAFGGEAMMTRADHENGTSRIAEVVQRLGDGCPEVVVNVQGDEPEVEPGVIDAVVAGLLADAGAPMATVGSPFAEGEEVGNPNVVKVVLDRRGRAMLFSRAVIPFDRDGDRVGVEYLRHVGLYAYRREFLPVYAALDPTPLERAERLEQLRALEHGHAITVVVVPEGGTQVGIDTPEQYAAFVRRVEAERPG